LFYPSPWPFSALALIFIAAAAWEWARLVGYGQAIAVGSAVFVVLICALAWGAGVLQQPLHAWWAVVALCWVVGGTVLLRGGVALWSRLWPGVRLGLGFVVLFAAWLAVAQARHVGVNFLLSILALVWVADIGAYFAGRGLGGRFVRRKLAPGISPGKTWEGALGGLLGVIVLAVCWNWVDTRFNVVSPSFYSQVLAGGRWFMLVAIAGLAAMSVVGDLTESLIKRSAGQKDSSRLLPGHGGVLDRIDALLPTVPLAMWVFSL
ncbi:MAG: phosphatidate cytidylyltransferase, partial [Burkholderiaceae bacterium]